jgi:hypothetical protein
MKPLTSDYNQRQIEYYRIRNINKGLPTIKCLICGKDFRQVGSHITQVHGITAREYRETFELEVKKGLLPPDLRELKGNQALENGTWKNLKVGKKYWFKKGQEGVGVYKRSKITLEKLKALNKTRK